MNQNTKLFILFGVITAIVALSFVSVILGMQNQLSQKNQQIQTLQDQIKELENDLGTVKKGEWNVVDSFGGSSEFATDYFYVAGTELRITWVTYSSLEESMSFGIDVYKEGQSEPLESFTLLQDEGSVFLQSIEKGNYYLNISEDKVDQWSITVETWISPE